MSDALSARSLNGTVKQPRKKEHSTDEALLGQKLEIWRLQQWIGSPNLVVSLWAICTREWKEPCANLPSPRTSRSCRPRGNGLVRYFLRTPVNFDRTSEVRAIFDQNLCCR